MKDVIRSVGTAVIAMAIIGASLTPVAAHYARFRENSFGNYGDGSGSIEEHHGRYYYTGRHGIHGHPPHEVWSYPRAYDHTIFHRHRPHGASQPTRAHHAWCASHYRSYRPSDNSFQPHHGGRRACLSPYWH